MPEEIRIEQHSTAGLFWIAAWLFTAGLLDLSVGKVLFALVLWPYYLGGALGPLLSGG